MQEDPVDSPLQKGDGVARSEPDDEAPIGDGRPQRRLKQGEGTVEVGDPVEDGRFFGGQAAYDLDQNLIPGADPRARDLPGRPFPNRRETVLAAQDVH